MTSTHRNGNFDTWPFCWKTQCGLMGRSERFRGCFKHTRIATNCAVTSFSNWSEQSLRREWLVTNGIGGYAAGTIAGCQTRRYHGLLVAATAPPVGRSVLLVDLDVVATVGARQFQLACHEYGGGAIHPTGHFLLQSFQLQGTVPTWTFALGPLLLPATIRS